MLLPFHPPSLNRNGMACERSTLPPLRSLLP